MKKENADSITSSARNNKYQFIIIKHNLRLYHAVHRPIAKSVVAVHDGDADEHSGVTANGRPEVLDSLLFKLYTQ